MFKSSIEVEKNGYRRTVVTTLHYGLNSCRYDLFNQLIKIQKNVRFPL